MFQKQEFGHLNAYINAYQNNQIEQEETQDEQEQEQSDAQQPNFIPSTTTKTSRGTIHCLTIIGQIEGHIILPPHNKTTKYEHVIPQLVAVEESTQIDGLLIILNTAGGDVEAGLAIAEMISSMKKPTVSLVLGGGHSIGVPLAVASKYSIIAPTATMTIHPIRMNGMVVGVPQTFNYFDKMQDRIVHFVEDNSNIAAEEFRKLCFKTGELASDVGSVLDGKEAVSIGLINSLGGLSDAIEKLYEQIGKEKKNMFDSVTPYGEIFDCNRKEENTKIIRKNQCMYEAQCNAQGKYRIVRLLSTDPKLYLNIENQPGQYISEQKQWKL